MRLRFLPAALLALAASAPATAQHTDAARVEALARVDAFRIAANDAAYGPGGVDARRRAALEDAQRRVRKDPRVQAYLDAEARDAQARASDPPDIVALAAGAGTFQTLVAAVRAAGLVETLQGEGPFTVFAPTDDAFARLGDDAVAQLLRPENRARLTAILTYHVVPGRVTAAQVGRLRALETVNGEALSLGVRVNDAALVATDLEASNGIVHVIDRVLMPREMPAARRASSRGRH